MAGTDFNNAALMDQKAAQEQMDELVTRIRFAAHKDFFKEIVDMTLNELPVTQENVDLTKEFGIYVNRIERTARKLGIKEAQIAGLLTRVADCEHAPDALVDIAVKAVENIELKLG